MSLYITAIAFIGLCAVTPLAEKIKIRTPQAFSISRQVNGCWSKNGKCVVLFSFFLREKGEKSFSCCVVFWLALVMFGVMAFIYVVNVVRIKSGYIDSYFKNSFLTSHSVIGVHCNLFFRLLGGFWVVIEIKSHLENRHNYHHFLLGKNYTCIKY